jgi:uncharacterized protein YpmS
MRKPSAKVYILFAVLLLPSLACGPCDLFSSAAPTPSHALVVSSDAAAQLESRIQQNLNGERGQQFILRMTDSELTSLLSTKLAEYDESPVSDPQVWFTKGKIYGTGRLANVLPIETEFFIVASARIDDGKVIVEVEDISAGALPLPDSALTTISQSMNETVEELQLDVEVSALEILEGEMIVKGVRK